MSSLTALKEANGTVQALLERHSVRKYKKDQVIPQDKLRAILEIAARAPSAWNLQHWKLLLVQEQADKEKLFPIAFSQRAVLDSSVIVVILGDTQADKNAAAVYGHAVEAGTMAADAAERYVANIEETYKKAGIQFGRNHAYLNGGLISMQLMIAATALGYATLPMSGFDGAKLSEAFAIDPRYIPIMLVAIGLSDEPPHQSFRFPVEEMIYHSGK